MQRAHEHIQQADRDGNDEEAQPPWTTPEAGQLGDGGVRVEPGAHESESDDADHAENDCHGPLYHMLDESRTVLKG
jgi:hypothetical protein